MLHNPNPVRPDPARPSPARLPWQSGPACPGLWPSPTRTAPLQPAPPPCQPAPPLPHPAPILGEILLWDTFWAHPRYPIPCVICIRCSLSAAVAARSEQRMHVTQEMVQRSGAGYITQKVLQSTMSPRGRPEQGHRAKRTLRHCQSFSNIDVFATGPNIVTTSRTLSELPKKAQSVPHGPATGGS
jgi:hypothetical protein